MSLFASFPPSHLAFPKQQLQFGGLPNDGERVKIMRILADEPEFRTAQTRPQLIAQLLPGLSMRSLRDWRINLLWEGTPEQVARTVIERLRRNTDYWTLMPQLVSNLLKRRQAATSAAVSPDPRDQALAMHDVPVLKDLLDQMA